MSRGRIRGGNGDGLSGICVLGWRLICKERMVGLFLTGDSSQQIVSVGSLLVDRVLESSPFAESTN